MRRIVVWVQQNPKESLLFAALFPVFCYAVRQDKPNMDWWVVVLSALLGIGLGLFLIKKVVRPTLAYFDAQIARLFK